MHLAFTGHRPSKLGSDYELKSPLIHNIKTEIINKVDIIKPDMFVVGMALGIDTLAALIAIEKHIPFTAAIPFVGQEKAWPIPSRMKYYEILKQAAHIHICDIRRGGSYHEYLKYPPTSYSAQKMDDRNHWMVDNCNKLIAVWDGTPGGTANCVRYAQRPGHQVEIIQINPQLFRHGNHNHSVGLL